MALDQRNNRVNKKLEELTNERNDKNLKKSMHWFGTVDNGNKKFDQSISDLRMQLRDKYEKRDNHLEN